MRNLALLGIDLLMIFLALGVGGFGFFLFRGDGRFEDMWTDASVGATALVLLFVGRMGVKRAKVFQSVLALVICAIYAFHFGSMLAEIGTLPNGIIWIAMVGSFAGVIGIVGSFALNSPPLGKKT